MRRVERAALAKTAGAGRRSADGRRRAGGRRDRRSGRVSSPPRSPAGLRLLQIPTTLLAQVDSSVGGKVGINLPGAKNMVGAFWQPLGVLVDTAVLDSLPKREYRLRPGRGRQIRRDSGRRIFRISGSATWRKFWPARARRCEHVVARCCRLKADVVEADERELTGSRAVLNYGHTFCHAFETVTGYGTLLHGEAVSIGMTCAARLAARLGRVDARFVDRQQKLLAALGLPVEVPDVDPDGLLAVMARDKKNMHGQLRFVLPSRLGHVELVDGVQPADARAALQTCI